MSSVDAEDKQLWNASSQLSCQIMTQLAQDEARRNNGPLSYQVVHPVCEKYQQLADREAEHLLQKTNPHGKKACFMKQHNYQDGPWTAQFASPLHQNDVAFDIWSRRKGTPLM